MLTLFCSNTQCRLAELKDAVAKHLRPLPEKIAPIGTPLNIHRYEFTCEPISILTWLHNQTPDTCVYWSNRSQSFEVGGLGTADLIAGNDSLNYKDLFNYMEDRLSPDNPHLRYYGGIRFQESQIDEEWKAYGHYQFLVPRFELVHTAGQTTFAVNIAVKDIQAEQIKQILEELNRINFAGETSYRKPPHINSRTDYPNKQEWNQMFNRISESKEMLPLEKIVLARKSVFDFDVTLRSCALLKHLKEDTPNCFHFLFQPNDSTAFLGATPERLFKRSALKIKTEAIAGTRPRNGDDLLDKSLAEELLNSDKDAREHEYVTRTIFDSLNGLCHSVDADPIFQLRKLKGSQHLVTRFSGFLKDNIIDRHIISSLHPTPAVAGSPTDTALKTIGQLEPFDRGWYAGPVGYVGHDQTEFAVAIRSGLIQNNQLSLYAGAGIVQGSTAEEEWNEIENKISNFISVFNHVNLSPILP